jgi:hypothetical protein
MIIAAIRSNLPQLHSPVGSGCLFGGGGAFRAACADVGFGGCCNAENASQDLVSARTCMAYRTPPCLAKVQLKNLSPDFGLKFAQLPHILLVMLLTFYGPNVGKLSNAAFPFQSSIP